MGIKASFIDEELKVPHKEKGKVATTMDQGSNRGTKEINKGRKMVKIKDLKKPMEEDNKKLLSLMRNRIFRVKRGYLRSCMGAIGGPTKIKKGGEKKEQTLAFYFELELMTPSAHDIVS